ncbi:GNAT family N-acetyltransferase [Actinocrispum wychmicini]|uniref:RimJ/RimL family protein N-acetyltransferase n=1 Tax=Actinocrispum wychmicini TaxID=1213861 RepID=A0A4R2JCE6_9PSEU|nr:GNAT family protein [Actinocrispum wychmicini]TCO53789.1 RimJ/RimL family protein N-acetyltransferase [Actinocrispum wychmicini]
MLTGELVTLRPIEPADYPALAVFTNDLEVALLVGGLPPVPVPLASVSAIYERRRENPDEVNFAITSNEGDGLLIGQCGLFRHDPIGRTCELGIAIGDRDHWGRGYGRETVSMLSDYAFRVRNIRKVCLSVNATNERALRAYVAAGFVEEGRRLRHVWSDGEYIDMVLMARFQ